MPYRPVRVALVAALVAAPTFTRAQAAPDALPYLPAEQLRAEARAISDGLDAYVRGWLDGDNPPEIPDGLLPSGAASTNGGAFRDWRLVRYEDIVAEDQWVVREARPVNPGSIYALFPDPHATYIISWATLVPFGHKVVVEGEFPWARFFDLQTIASYWPGEYAKGYIGAGELPWVDVDIDPVPGSVNPFRPGTDRNAPNRRYRAEFVAALGEPQELNGDAFRPPFRSDEQVRYMTGIMNTGPWGDPRWITPLRRLQTLGFSFTEWTLLQGFAEGAGAWTPGEMWLRYYAPDPGKGAMGGVPLPQMHYETPQGERYFIAYDDTEVEAQANATRPLPVYPGEEPLAGSSREGWTKLYGILRSGLNVLANTPYPWLFDLSEDRAREIDLYVAGRGEDVEGAGGLETSKTLVPYTNYIVRDERVDEGDVLVLYGRMPRFPDTRSGPATMPTGQIRYWSLTTYNTGDLYGAGEATASVMDDELVYDAECRYVLVLSRPQDRPANATAANGVTWMPWRDVTQQSLFMRYLSVEDPQNPSQDWAFEYTPDERFLPPAETGTLGADYDENLIGLNSHEGAMGEYVPKLSYLSRADFEALGGAVSFSTIPEWGRTPTPVGVTPPRSYEGGCATGGAPGDGAEAFPQDGLPYLLRDAATGRYLDTGTGGVVQTQPDADGDDRQWRFLASGSGAYRIDNGAPGRGALDARAGGAVRWADDAPAGDDRLWTVEDAGDGAVRFRSGAAGRGYLAAGAGGTVTWTASASAAARWEPVPAGGADRAVEADDGELVTFAVEAARPNPFRTRATIRYALPGAADVRLDVFDVTGRRVATLVDGPRRAGWHEAAFDGTGLPAGLYLYRLQAGPDTATGRVVRAE